MKNQDVRPEPAADGSTGSGPALRPAAEATPLDQPALRQLLDDYLRMYASRDDRLTTQFSEDFSGFTGGGDFLVKDRAAWVAITRQDFAQVKDPIRIELKDVTLQLLAETIAVATSFFTIHLPIKDHILSRETARLVLIFRKESAGWKIAHSSISIPYYLVREGEVYPLKELVERNRFLEEQVAERTSALSEANDHLRRMNEELAREIAGRKQTDDALQRSEERYRSIVTVSVAWLLFGLGSPSLTLLIDAELVKVPSRSGRLTTITIVTDWPCSSWPPVWSHSASEPEVLQVKVAVLPPEGVAVTLAKVVRPAMKAGMSS